MQGFTRRALGAVLGLMLLVSLFYGLIVSDYVEWLRFRSPNVPDQATGQVVYMKMAKGVFFGTLAQYELSQSIWVSTLITAGAMILIKWLKLEANTTAPARGESPGMMNYVVGVIITSGIIVILFFGDHLMQLIFSGYLNLPPENERPIPQQFIPAQYRS